MKKSLVALAVLGSFAGVASAATSVTLYGQVEVGYRKFSGHGDFASGAATTSQVVAGVQKLANRSIEQYPRRSDRIGVTGQEDLGNGLAATFKLEGNIAADVGSANLFNREATVGLKGDFGQVRLGRARAPMDMAVGGLSGAHGVADTDTYTVASTRYSNGLFYDISKNGFDFGAAVTTKGGAAGNTTEGAKDGEIAYGARIGYSAKGFSFRAAYQNDGKVAAQTVSLINPATGLTYAAPNPAYGKKQYEYIVGAGYNFYEQFKVPVGFGVSYARGQGYARGFISGTGISTLDTVWADKATTLSGIVRAYFSPKDTAYVLFSKRKSQNAAGANLNNAWTLGAGYEHKLSKRTSVFADAIYLKAKSIAVTSPLTPNPVVTPVKGGAYGYSVGVSHSF